MRVVCGFDEVIATLVPTRALVSVDLPAFGRPTNEANPLRKAARQHPGPGQPSQVGRSGKCALPSLSGLTASTWCSWISLRSKDSCEPAR